MRWLVSGLFVALSIAPGGSHGAEPNIPAPAPATSQTPAPSPGKEDTGGGVMQLDWEDLLPENERTALDAAPPPPMHDYLSGEYGAPAAQRMSFNVNEALEGRTVKVPGFIVPLEADGKGKIVEFFLVPYFGACIHVPPPPPNQIVFVKFPQGIALDSIYEAYWVTGRLALAGKTTRMGAAAYTLHGEGAEVYKY